MLVLSRKLMERIIIGDGLVTITVVDIQPGQVKLGIEADASLPIHREEVYLAIKRGKSRKNGLDRA